MVLSGARSATSSWAVDLFSETHHKLRLKWNEPARRTSPAAAPTIMSGPSPTAMWALGASDRW